MLCKSFKPRATSGEAAKAACEYPARAAFNIFWAAPNRTLDAAPGMNFGSLIRSDLRWFRASCKSLGAAFAAEACAAEASEAFAAEACAAEASEACAAEAFAAEAFAAEAFAAGFFWHGGAPIRPRSHSPPTRAMRARPKPPGVSSSAPALQDPLPWPKPK